MSGQGLQDTYVTTVVTAFGLFLSWYLLGPAGAIIFTGTTVLGTVLKQTSPEKPKPARSRKILPLSASLPSESVFEHVTVRRGRDYTPESVPVTPDGLVLKLHKRRRPLKPLGDKPRSISFDEDS